MLVQDNLNTHTPASLYEAFPPAEARRLVERFEWHYTPKHGSWLDMAESELGVSPRNASTAASPTPPRSKRGRRLAAAPQQHHAKADWHFTTADARVKLKSLYPQFE